MNFTPLWRRWTGFRFEGNGRLWESCGCKSDLGLQFLNPVTGFRQGTGQTVDHPVSSTVAPFFSITETVNSSGFFDDDGVLAICKCDFFLFHDV